MKRFSKASLVALIGAFLLGLSATAQAEEAQGKLKAVFADRREFVLADSAGKTLTFQFAREGKVLINNKTAKLEDLLAGEQISVVFERPVDMPEATEIRCKRD